MPLRNWDALLQAPLDHHKVDQLSLIFALEFVELQTIDRQRRAQAARDFIYLR